MLSERERRKSGWHRKQLLQLRPRLKIQKMPRLLKVVKKQ
jgi:hypothetical protein